MKNTSLQAVSIGPNAARLPVPLPFSDQPLVLADAHMARLFREVGSDRGLFAGAADWPVLEDLLAAHSRAQFKQLGAEEWAARGGRHRPDGGFTCDLHSAMTTDVVNQVVREHAGLYWRDADTERLRAIRFLPRRGADAPLLGLSLVSGESEGKTRGRARLASAARRLRLTRRAEQAYWTLFGLVRQQRRSQVLLPDVLLRQIIWGATGWPRDWRAEAVTVLRGLTAVRAELLRVRAVGWQPDFGSSSALVDHLEDLAVTDPQADRRCGPLCPHHGRGRHHHFRVGIGQGFLGVLERHCTGSDGAARVYDFFNSGGQDKPRRDAQVLVHLPTAVSAPAKWSGLPQEEVGVIRGVVSELTRDKAGRKRSGTPPLLLHGNRVPNLAAKTLIRCPHLNPDADYTVFGGNGVRAGAGYKIVGDNGGGWVAKCGFELPDDADPGELCRVVRRFLKVLSRVGPKFDLTVAGLQSTPHGLAWHTVAEMNRLAAGRAGVERLLGVHLRVYGPPDALDRLSGFFADRGGFAVGSTTMVTRTAPATGSDLGPRLLAAGLTQKAVAGRLGVSPSFVSQVVSGSRPLPPRHAKRLQKLLAAEGA